MSLCNLYSGTCILPILYVSHFDCVSVELKDLICTLDLLINCSNMVSIVAILSQDLIVVLLFLLKPDHLNQLLQYSCAAIDLKIYYWVEFVSKIVYTLGTV